MKYIDDRKGGTQYVKHGTVCHPSPATSSPDYFITYSLNHLLSRDVHGEAVGLKAGHVAAREKFLQQRVQL